jgi:hypothetical protein
LVVAIALACPDFTWPTAGAMSMNIRETRPAIRSVTTCGLLRYGTAAMSMPARRFKASPESWPSALA